MAGSKVVSHLSLAVSLLVIWAGVGNAQERADRVEFRKPGVRRRMAFELAEHSRARRQFAHQKALSQHWQPRGQTEHTIWQVMAIDDDFVYVYKTLNLNAGISVDVHEIRQVEPYYLDGDGQRIGVWDAGAIRATHQEFGARVNLLEDVDKVSHSTHVAGTIGAAGVVYSSIGMAPLAIIDGYDFNDDLSEMTLAAMSYAAEPNKLQVSNHSYGTVSGWDYNESTPKWYGRWGSRESDVFGKYDSEARDRDRLCYNAPYYLPFFPAGNDRNEDSPVEGEAFEYYTFRLGWVTKEYDSSTDPYDDGWDDGGFDTMLPTSTAKNVMTVGAVGDAVARDGRDLGNATMTQFSGWGPTDDGRIKPDIVTNGASVYSTTASTDSSYGSFSGTSMATAGASGASLLLLESWEKYFPGTAMRSSTLKGLIIHTADDLGNPGPDYRYGWGLMNAKAAVDHIGKHNDCPRANMIVEGVLDDDVTFQIYTFVWDGENPIRVSLVWTDPAAPSVNGLDNPSPRLVNDLDLRIVDPCEAVHYPFVLDRSQPDQAATTGDNTLDNIEQIVIQSPPTHGVYKACVEYKGALVNGEQHYSFFLSGQSPEYALTADFDHDGLVDLQDLAILTSYWLTDEESVDIAPGDGDRIIDFLDFAKFAEQFERAN